MKKCKICKSDTLTLIDEKTLKNYYNCPTCSYIYLDEQHYIDEDSEKKHYDKHHNNLESLGYVTMFEDLINEFIEPLQNIKTALDFGCGEGEVLPILLDRRGVKCDRYDVFYFPEKVYTTKKYDLITSTEVFEHLENPIAVLKELLLHVKENGYIVLMSAFHPDDNDTFLNWWYIRDITHIGFFNLITFEYIAKELNLDIIKHNSKNTIMFRKVST